MKNTEADLFDDIDKMYAEHVTNVESGSVSIETGSCSLPTSEVLNASKKTSTIELRETKETSKATEIKAESGKFMVMMLAFVGQWVVLLLKVCTVMANSWYIFGDTSAQFQQSNESEKDQVGNTSKFNSNFYANHGLGFV